ncbi:cobyrinate a,c-diamide synthase [Kaustia mangrovi]|uniref:Hydrogenobyrinate a,c-diamide synthase n=1 Tax=Kaustia mangrovi TaxID=2593653 RepID=A0A7S8C6M3_9HYPH|nr:cobyrinate a,c-diamide synthase [Kaustia mangrovi]QPC44375.1 cobyrinate a,c-diamide synthase [Kaustia mangrovi]
MNGLVIAAPSSGAGKTLVTLGLLRALSRAGHDVAGAKAGPDYIDPRFHEAACGRPSVNLDPWAMRPGLLARLARQDADLLLVEGVMGLFDGAETGAGSTADLASRLGLPVVLVVDAKAQAQSAAALVQGFAGFREDCTVAGVILNRVGSARHADLIRAALGPSGLPVLGALPYAPDIAMPSRHLGLVQAGEHPEIETLMARAGALAARSVDLDALAALARPLESASKATPDLPPPGQRIALARDEAFAFAYPHLLHGWRAAGADVVPFSPLADEGPDKAADAVVLPGGYPELHAGRLAANAAFLGGLRQAAARGALVYGECGGYMALGEALIDADGTRHAMAGLLPVVTSFAERRMHLGYRRLVHSGALPWPAALRGHEFHFSTLAGQGDGEPLFEATDVAGRALEPMGLRRGRVMGSYAHVIDAEEAP